jgi:hypothetical protein
MITEPTLRITSLEKKPSLFIIRDSQHPADIICLLAVKATDILHETCGL